MNIYIYNISALTNYKLPIKKNMCPIFSLITYFQKNVHTLYVTLSVYFYFKII